MLIQQGDQFFFKADFVVMILLSVHIFSDFWQHGRGDAESSIAVLPSESFQLVKGLVNPTGTIGFDFADEFCDCCAWVNGYQQVYVIFGSSAQQ